MSTPAMQWAQLVGNLTSQAAQRKQQQQQFGVSSGIQQQQTDIEARQEQLREEMEQRDAQQRQWEDVSHAMSPEVGGRHVQNGMVWDTQPDAAGNPQPVLRPVNTKAGEFITKFPGAKGVPDVEVAIPSQIEQSNNRMRLKQQEAQAQAQGTGAGDTASKQADLEARGIPVTQDFANQYGLAPSMVGQKILPETRDNLMSRIGAVNTRNTGLFDRTAYKADLDNQIKSRQLDLKQQEFDERESDQNKWNQAQDATKRYIVSLKSGSQKFSQNAVDARSFMDNFARLSQQHTALKKSLAEEQQKQIGAAGILGTDPSGAPIVADGEEFQDPFTKGKVNMNAAQRVILQSRLRSSQQNLTDIQNKIGQLESVRDGLMQRIGGTQGGTAPIGSPSGTPPAGGAAPAGGVAPPQGAPRTGAAPATPGPQPRAAGAAQPGAGQQPKIASPAQVRAYAAQKGITEAQAKQEFQQSGYAVK